MQATTYSTYPVFEADQVLTSQHLNDLVNYLEEQERFSRNKLIGIGIGCGLEVALSADKTTVSVTPGVGITSEGYLMAFHGESHGETAHFSFFTPFSFGERQPYSFFKKGEKESIGLFELHGQKTEGAEPFTELEGGIEDYVVFLFLDCMDKKLKNCVENDCNEKGTERSFTIRPLLVRKSDARDIICREAELNVPKTETQIDQYVNARFHLPAVEVPRFLTGRARLSHYNDLYAQYDRLITGYIPVLQEALREAYRLFRPLLRGTFGTANPFQNNGTTDLQAKYNSVKSKSPFAVQYFYDLLRDLTDTYNEFREAAFDLVSECCPPSGRFPKHLRLGDLATTAGCRPSAYRTRFVYSPLLNEQGHLKQRVLSLFRKMTLLPAKFSVPLTEQIKITPGRPVTQPLSHRAIPYYYNVLNEGSLLKNWDADRKRKCRYNENLSFHSNRYAGHLKHILHPLQYDHDQYEFLRIEGHLGMNYRKALSSILSLRNDQNLPFDVVALSLSENASGTTVDFSECHFRDLEILCQAWQKELSCTLGDVVKGLSRVSIGATLGKATLAPRDSTGPAAAFNLTTFQPMFSATHLTPKAKVADVVRESIEKKEGTLGAVLHEAVKTETVGGGDYFVRAESLLLRDEDIRQLNRDEYELAFAQPMLVAARAVAVAEKVTTTCDKLDLEKLEAAMRQLLNAAATYQTRLTNYKATDTAKVQVNTLQMIRLMSILIGRCTLEQLKIIKAEIERRKELLRKQNLFAEFVAKNPGIAHYGGVPKGGTFLLVYHDISRQDTPVHKGPFDLRGRVLDDKNQPLAEIPIVEKKTERKAISGFDGFFTMRVDNLPAILSATIPGFDDLELEVFQPNVPIVIQPGGGSGRVFPQPERFTVIADFYLPYLCCSDCPPIDYVILPPEGKEALELTPKSYCMPVEENFPGALFSVYPAKGIVTGPGVSGDVASGFVFNPKDLDMGNNDEVEVKGFKVNGEEVALTVVLYKKPEAKFAATVKPADPTGDGLFGQLTLKNQSSQNAIKFLWQIQRALVNGELVENHIIETEKREDIVLDTFFRRGEDFVVRLTAFSQHCEGQTKQPVEVPFSPRKVTFQLFDPSGNKMTTNIIQRSVQGAFTLLASPGRGELGPKEVVRKLKMELASVSDQTNKYVFNARNGSGTITLKYTLPEGVSKTIKLTFKGNSGGGGGLPGGGGFIPVRPVITGGGVVLDPVILVGGGGGRTPGADSFSALVGAHREVLEKIRNDALFRTALRPSDAAFRVTSSLNKELLARLSDGPRTHELAAGKFNADFARKMEVALKDTAARMARANSPKVRDLIGLLLKIQLEMLLGMAAIQSNDPGLRDPLSRLFTRAINVVKDLRQKGVNVDKRKALSKALTAVAKNIKNKPKIKKRANDLIARVKG